MRKMEARLFLRSDCVLGEGPFWHAERLWWVDIEGGFLLSCNEAGGELEKIDFGQRCASAVPAEDGNFLVALEREIVRLDLARRTWEAVARPEDLAQDSRFNDGKCDPRGRLIVGTMSPDGKRPDASLYSLGADFKLRRLRGGISISNGLAWSADGATLYFIDTPTRCVLAYDYDLDRGSLNNQRIALRFAQEDGWPDGMTIDRQGRLWIGFWDGWAVRCHDPLSGACEAVVRVPCARPTSCCLGGAKLDLLFMTTARVGLSPAELKDQPLAGSIFYCKPESEGHPVRRFEG